MHDPSVLLWDNKILEIWHEEPGGQDSGSVCRHPSMRRHPHHWRVRFMPYVRLRRRLERCAMCGRRMNRATRFGYMSSDKVWHKQCSELSHQRSDRKLLLEVLDRLASAHGIDDQETLRSLVVRPERRDQFLLYSRTWQMLTSYRASDDKWRAPNEHITGT